MDYDLDAIRFESEKCSKFSKFKALLPQLHPIAPVGTLFLVRHTNCFLACVYHLLSISGAVIKWLLRHGLKCEALAGLICFGYVLSHSAGAAETGPEAAKPKKKHSWDWRFEVGSRFTYDNNVFRQSDEQTDRLEANRPEDAISGRYDDMESVDDFIVSQSLKVTAKGPGLSGKSLIIEPEVRYNYYFENTEKAFLQGGLRLEQSLGKGKALGLETSYALDVFRRNYLADATDLTGAVSADERVYAPGEADEFDIALGYSQPLWKRGKGESGMLGADLVEIEVMAGYGNVSFRDPHENRDLDIFRGGLGAKIEFSRSVEFSVHYQLAYAEAPNGTEVMIRDEQDFGVDFNNDGDAVDGDIRTVQHADRTRIDHSLGLKTAIRLHERLDLWLGYQVVFQNYLSNEEFDLSYNGREDLRHRVRLGLDWDLARHWDLRFEVQGIKEYVSNTLPATEEEREYDRFIVSLAVFYKF
jgi:hypothetical protein